jgi:hypothetical protein
MHASKGFTHSNSTGADITFHSFFSEKSVSYLFVTNTLKNLTYGREAEREHTYVTLRHTVCKHDTYLCRYTECIKNGL